LGTFSDVLIGDAPEMQAVHKTLARVSASRATVLIRGESGTGKELVARLIHENSPRAGGPFVRVNCAALSESLLESEMFGHERGAFTGATQTRRGRFEMAAGGTIFLDEIGDLSLTVQVKLLRVLQEMTFERVGGNQTISVDVRVITATHLALEQAIVDGKFRQDLYYRINVVPICLPPLRTRKSDAPLLIDHFLRKFNAENARAVKLSAPLMRLLGEYDWPGNVREMENCIERLVVLAEDEMITFKTIPASIATYFNDIQQVTPHPPAARAGIAMPRSLVGTMAGMEQEAIVNALDRCGWVQARAARALGMTPRQIAYKIRKYHLAPPADLPAF